MHTPLYRQAAHHAWKLVWKDKWLWVFGLFAAFLGQLGIAEFLTKVFFATSDVHVYLRTVGIFPAQVADLPDTVAAFDTRITFIWLLVVLLTLGIGMLFVAVVSHGTIIQATAQSVRRSKQLPDLGMAWHASVGHFWRLLSISVLKKLLLIGLAVVVSSAAFAALEEASVSGSLLFLITFVLSGIVGLVVSFLVVYAAGYVVVEEYPLARAIAAAWRLFVGHWLVSVEVGLLVLLFNVLAALAMFVGFVVFFLPAMLLWLLAAVVGSQMLTVLGLVLAVVLFTAFVMVLGAFFTVFTTAIWMYLFMKMHKNGIPSRIHHWLTFKHA